MVTYMDDYFVKLVSAEKAYGDKKALENVSLGFHQGRTVGILGGKNSGKTALCRLLAGIERPSAGKVLFEGRKIKAPTKKRISYLMSDDMIGRFRSIQKLFDFLESFYYDFDRKRASELIHIFGAELDGRITNNKGRNQLIALACLAARSADLYILDDPLTYFDRDERENYLREAFRGSENKPLKVICAENPRGLERFFDDVVFLHKGNVKLCKTAEEIRIKTNGGVEALYKEVFGNADL